MFRTIPARSNGTQSMIGSASCSFIVRERPAPLVLDIRAYRTHCAALASRSSSVAAWELVRPFWSERPQLKRRHLLLHATAPGGRSHDTQRSSSGAAARL